jgi:16S rRNA processing protein RimM
MLADSAELVVIGKITTVYGVKGWVKIHSYTEPMENFVGYQDYYLDRGDQWDPIDFDAIKRHGKGLVAQIAQVDDREQARLYCQCNIAVTVDQLPALAQGEFYWHQLEGLEVLCTGPDGKEQLLGKMHSMMETGANDVLVVRQSKGSIDKRERLIPWIPDEVITQVDSKAGVIRINWDPEF